jgi:peptidoglycan hydrolase CwlO-like protein
MPDVQDLAGRLVIAEQGQKMLRTENIDKLKERDAAIANLLQSVQANEGVISNLRNDIDNFKRKLNDSIEENRRLQHESEIFATQVGDFNTC